MHGGGRPSLGPTGIAYDPENPETHEVLGLLHLWLDQREEAACAFKQAMECLRGIDAPEPYRVERIGSRARRAGVRVGVRVRTVDSLPTDHEARIGRHDRTGRANP